MGKYRQGRKIFWATLALLLLVVAMPLSVAGVEYWNEHIAGTDAIAYEMNSDNDTIAQPTENPSLYRVAAFVDDGTIHNAEQSVFWQANSSWNEFIVQTGAGSTDNTSNRNRIYFNWNISAQDLVNANVNKIVIALKGVNANTTIRYSVRAINNGYQYGDSSNVVNLLDITNMYAFKTISLNNTTSATTTITLDPAMLKYAADHTIANNSHIGISLSSNDPANDFFTEGQVIYFRIYATHPHGRLVIGSYDATEVILAIWTGIGIAVLFVTSPAWNPTTHNGLIEHIIQHRRYSRARSSRSRSRRTHRTHRSSHRRRSTHRRRR